ncbi:MAG: hypothetical protein WAU86_05550 [Oricola sp.]
MRIGTVLIAELAMMVGLVFMIAAAPSQAQPVTVDSRMIEQLQQIINQQQELLGQQSQQLSSQAQTIETLSQRVDQLEQNAAQTQAIAAEAQTTAAQAIDTAQKSAAGSQPEALVTSGNERVKLAISGQVNRAVNFADDGDKTKAYFVDNDVSNTRVRFEGTAAVTDTTTVGSTVEVAFSPNNSYDVSQDNESADDFTDVRKADLWARNDAYGQLSFGKGSAAADDTAEYDLSLVAGPIMYSGVADPVGGMQFFDGAMLSGLTVGDAFFNFDGERQNRARYDTPVIGPGLQFSASAGDDQRYDAAITWGGDYGNWSGVEIGPFTTLGAFSIRDPNAENVDFRLAGSFSTLHNDSGLSLTVSGGMDEANNGDNPYNLYGKLGWDTSIFDIGATGFGVDATYSENVSAEGDEGMSFGLAAIQLVEEYGIEFYAQLRWFDLDRSQGDGVKDIVDGTVGSRVKF